MTWHKKTDTIKNIGFVSTRFQGTDGVSLETEKWIHVVEKMGFNTFFFAGLSDWDPARTMVIPEAFWEYPDVAEIQDYIFTTTVRPNRMTGQIHRLRQTLKDALYLFVNTYQIDMLIVENAVTIPMNIPFGLAITEFIVETGMPAIGHHHDFYWERQRFMVNCVPDYISTAFPPKVPSMSHVVINTEARKSLGYRRGLASIVIPNVFDFDRKPQGIDEYNKDLRKDLGISDDDIFVLQPTRVVARKGIEHAVEMVNRLDRKKKVKLVISHQLKDEGRQYYERIVDYARLMNVELIVRPDIVGAKRGTTEDGQKIYSLDDVYPHCDFVTYPSTYEGFGNAFLETIFFKKPLLVNRYSIFQSDIEPCGFEAVIMDTYITDEDVQKIRRILDDPDYRNNMVEKNFELGKLFFSYDILETKLKTILLNYGMKI
ncbi:MAG: glycosyltransferase family 4 protein [Spirochaetales bacterium]|nr:glycosyltransferase family 4 protein [Spirochaetales bacterium]